MQRFYFLLILFVSPFLAYTQPYIANSYFGDVDSIPCPWDTSQNINSFEEWELYQTLDDLWNGPVDSTICINSSSPFSYGVRVEMSQIDPSRKLFIRAKGDAALLENRLYRLSYRMNNSSGVNIDQSQNCGGEFCSSIIAGIQIPDSSGNSSDMRWYEGNFEDYMGGFGESAICLPTEYFDGGNVLTEVVLQLKIENYINEYDYIQIDYIEFMDIYQLTRIDPNENLAAYYYSGAYYLGGYYNNTMFMHEETYPNANNTSYFDFTPIPNVTDSQQVDVNLMGFSVFQPFVQFRGGLLEGDSVSRHSINLNLENDTVCVTGIVEVITENGNAITYHSGDVKFESKSSCMMFGKKGTLKIADNARMNYGNANRNGIMALKTGAQIEIGKHAELIIHNRIEMYEYETDDGPQNIYITLNEGAKLTFAEGSKLGNQYSKDGTMRLNVYMKGGEVDDKGLSGDDRLLINRIYDNPSEEFKDNVMIYENPFSDNLHYSLVGEQGQEFTILLHDMSGKLVHSKSETVSQQGLNFYNYYLPELGSGIYLFNIQTEKASISKKVVRF